MKSVQYCAASAPPIDPAVHRRIRLRRLGLQGATARLVSELAFGEPRDVILAVTVADTDRIAEAVS